MTQRVYRDPRWEPCRRKALTRDGYRCVRCSRPGRLEIHHKIPVKIARELAFKLSNLQTLCRPCHFDEHRAERLPADRLAWIDLLEGLAHARA